MAELRRLTGPGWTDFNVHDPGITILEQFAYALADLDYRIDHDMADLLASFDGEPAAHLHRAEDVLVCRPVTLSDLRRILLDVEGVRNVWVEPIDDDGLDLHYHPDRLELGFDAHPPSTQPVRLRGLHRVLIERQLDGTYPPGLVGRVAQRLHANRPLGEDFAEIRVLEEQLVAIDATIEIGPTERTESAMTAILDALTDTLAAPLPWCSARKAHDDGLTVDDLFDGPAPNGRYIEPGALDGSVRPTAIQTSDLIRELMDVDGVAAVTNISLRSGRSSERWSLALDEGKVPRLDLDRSRIELTRQGVPVKLDPAQVLTALEQRRAARFDGRAEDPLLAPPSGRDRRPGRYHSVQLQFPSVYGIGPGGLSSSVPVERRAKAAQLKAYLMILDQLVANGFAQLEGVGSLLSPTETTRTYQAGRIEDDGLGLASLQLGDYRERVERGVEPSGAGDESSMLDRKHRFLDHLLARYAEQLSDQGLRLTDPPVTDPDDLGPESGAGFGEAGPSRALIRRKVAFLTEYPLASAARGTGVDALTSHGGDNTDGLSRRIGLKLGLDPGSGEDLELVEHILLRPIPEDRTQDLPLLTDLAVDDPYSLQLSLVFSSGGRFAESAGRRFAERVVAEETPAHLTPYVRWLDPEEFASFRAANQGRHDRRRDHLMQRLELDRIEGDL